MRKTLRWLSLAAPLMALLGVGCSDSGSGDPDLTPFISSVALDNPYHEVYLDDDTAYTVEIDNPDWVDWEGVGLQVTVTQGTLVMEEKPFAVTCTGFAGELFADKVCTMDDFIAWEELDDFDEGPATVTFDLLDVDDHLLDSYVIEVDLAFVK